MSIAINLAWFPGFLISQVCLSSLDVAANIWGYSYPLSIIGASAGLPVSFIHIIRYE